jgi:hypothetical protein
MLCGVVGTLISPLLTAAVLREAHGAVAADEGAVALADLPPLDVTLLVALAVVERRLEMQVRDRACPAAVFVVCVCCVSRTGVEVSQSVVRQKG